MDKRGRSKRKGRMTSSGIAGFLIGAGITALGLYYAMVHGNTGAWFVIVIGLLFTGLISLIHIGRK
jgi:F0F1-type ATP synthase assembly protein I